MYVSTEGLNSALPCSALPRLMLALEVFVVVLVSFVFGLMFIAKAMTSPARYATESDPKRVAEQGVRERQSLMLARFKADLMLLNIIYGEGYRLFISHEALIATLKSSTHTHTRAHTYM